MYLIRFALTIIIFILELVPKPQRQYIMLQDEDDEVGAFLRTLGNGN